MYSMYVIHIDYTLRAYHAQVVHTIQHSVYTTIHTQDRAHNTIHTTLCTYIHLLDTYTIDDVYTYSIQYMETHTYILYMYTTG